MPMTIFDRKNLTLTIGDVAFPVQKKFIADDGKIPYWIAEHLETEFLKREFAKEESRKT